MSSNKNREPNRYNQTPVSPISSGNHSYVNLDETTTGKRLPSYDESNGRNGSNPRIQALTIDNVSKLPPKDTNNNIPQNNSKAKISKNWYSPPNSVTSDSRPPSIIGLKTKKQKDNSKLRTIDEDNVQLPIDKLLNLCNNNNGEIQLNALAFLQHLIFSNSDKKMEVRNNNGLRIIIDLTRSSKPLIVNAALGVLKNMSFTEMEMITTDIERLGGIQRMISIIKGSKDNLQTELAIDILWNLSVHFDLKNIILTETVEILIEYIIIPETKLVKEDEGNYVPIGEDINWSILLRNALGIIRNISYESTEARIKLREDDGLIDCILHIIFMSKDIQEEDINEDKISLIDSKIVENAVCILRNLTYAIQEIVDPTYLQTRTNSTQKPPTSKGKANDKKQQILSPKMKENPVGVELLWNSKYIVAALFPILKYGANAVTLEAATGIVQNLSAGDWEPSCEMQTEFRLKLALPTLVELIDIAPDEVVRSAATALRNLVREQHSCMLIGTNGLRTITEKIPFHSRSKKISNQALGAILSAVYAIIKNEEEFMKEFITAKGAKRCIYVRDSEEFLNPEDEFPDKLMQFCKFILQLLWKTPSTREILKKNNYKQSDIIPSRNIDPCNLCSPSKNTKPIQLYDISNQDSLENDNNHQLPTQYNENKKYDRDSCSTFVSNHGLQQRNSRAYKKNNIPEYGEVKIPMKNYKITSEDQKNENNFVAQTKSKNRNDSQYSINPYIENKSKYNSRNGVIETPINSKNTQKSIISPVVGLGGSYDNKTFLEQDDILPYYTPKSQSNKPNSKPRLPPNIPNERQSNASSNSNAFNYEYSIPNKPNASAKVKPTKKSDDSWV